MSNRFAILGAAAVLALSVFVCVAAFRHNDANIAQAKAVSNNNSTVVVSALSTLETSPQVVDRVNAARTVATSASINAQDIQRLSHRLLSDTTPQVRSAIASSLEKVATTQNQGNIWVGPNEDQMVQALHSAYHNETDVLVKVSIIHALAAFNHPDAQFIVEEASQSTDPALAAAARDAHQQMINRRILHTASTPDFRQPLK
jgi:fructose-specific component phosphotransferase system IIB-like protein